MQVSLSASHVRPVPLGGLVAQEGGLRVTVRSCPWRFQNLSGNFLFRPKKSGRTNFRPEFFWNFQISNQKKSGRRNFSPTFFSFFLLSTGNFFGFSTFAAKKSPGFMISGSRQPAVIHDGNASQLYN
jgi:hypothetical protein